MGNTQIQTGIIGQVIKPTVIKNVKNIYTIAIVGA